VKESLKRNFVEDELISNSRKAKETLQQQQVKKYGAFSKNALQRMKQF